MLDSSHGQDGNANTGRFLPQNSSDMTAGAFALQRPVTKASHMPCALLLNPSWVTTSPRGVTSGFRLSLLLKEDHGGHSRPPSRGRCAGMARVLAVGLVPGGRSHAVAGWGCLCTFCLSFFDNMPLWFLSMFWSPPHLLLTGFYGPQQFIQI